MIPIIDLRQKFGLAEIPCTERPCIIVVEIDITHSIVFIGIVVDAVSEVLSIREEEIEETALKINLQALSAPTLKQSAFFLFPHAQTQE